MRAHVNVYHSNRIPHPFLLLRYIGWTAIIVSNIPAAFVNANFLRRLHRRIVCTVTAQVQTTFFAVRCFNRLNVFKPKIARDYETQQCMLYTSFDSYKMSHIINPSHLTCNFSTASDTRMHTLLVDRRIAEATFIGVIELKILVHVAAFWYVNTCVCARCPECYIKFCIRPSFCVR